MYQRVYTNVRCLQTRGIRIQSAAARELVTRQHWSVCVRVVTSGEVVTHVNGNSLVRLGCVYPPRLSRIASRSHRQTPRAEYSEYI